MKHGNLYFRAYFQSDWRGLSFVYMSDFNAALLHDMAFSKLKWCDYDIVSQGCSKAPKLMWRQRENNGKLKRQALLRQMLGDSRSLKITVSLNKMKPVYCTVFLCVQHLWIVASLDLLKIGSFKRSEEFSTRVSTCPLKITWKENKSFEDFAKPTF